MQREDRSVSADALTRAAELLDNAQPGRVIQALLACPDQDVKHAAIVAVDLEGGNPQRAAAELRRAANS